MKPIDARDLFDAAQLAPGETAADGIARIEALMAPDPQCQHTRVLVPDDAAMPVHCGNCGVPLNEREQLLEAVRVIDTLLRNHAKPEPPID